MATPSFNHIFPFLRELPRCPLMFNYWLPHSLLLAIQISGGSRGGLPLCLDQTEAWKAEKIFFETAPPLISEFGWTPPPPPPPPLSEGLYNLYMYVHFYINRFYRVERNIRMHTIFFKNFLTNTHPLSCCSMVRLLHICTWESLKMQRVCFRML